MPHGRDKGTTKTWPQQFSLKKNLISGPSCKQTELELDAGGQVVRPRKLFIPNIFTVIICYVVSAVSVTQSSFSFEIIIDNVLFPEVNKLICH